MLYFNDLKHLGGPIWRVTLFKDRLVLAHAYRVTHYEFRRTCDFYTMVIHRSQESFEFFFLSFMSFVLPFFLIVYVVCIAVLCCSLSIFFLSFLIVFAYHFFSVIFQ